MPPTSTYRSSAGGFTLLELMIVVAIVGILAAVAVPSFIKYIAKSRTTEARQQLEKIYNGARVYYMDVHHRPGEIQPVEAQFPASVSLTPALSCCTLGGKCEPSATAWETPSWVGLAFSMSDPHYYQYDFTSAGTGGNARFTARAVGNLDCDNTFSTFLMWSRVNEGRVVGGATISRVNELE